MITRTMKTSIIKAMVVNTASKDVAAMVRTEEIEVDGVFKDFSKGGEAWKYVNELPRWNAAEIVASVELVRVDEWLYVATDEDFRKIAKKMPPRAKATEAEATEAEAEQK